MAEEKTALKKNKKTESKQVQVPQGLYSKCRSCGELLHQRELDQNLKVCPKCGHHYPLTAWERLYLTADSGTFEEWDEGVISGDPLQFPQYPERYRRAQEKTGLLEAVVTGRGRIEKIPVALAITDFAFMGGSMGGAVGEKITRAIERAISKKIGMVILSASGGGARMQEGILSLMQMAKISAALAKLGGAGLPYISVLTDPTAGGVAASFGMLGDVNLAEPGAMIGFAGPRVIEQTIRQKLPKGFQRAEFLLEHGFVDEIVPRARLKKTIAFYLRVFRKKK